MRAVVEATRPVWELLRDLALVPWRPVQAVLGEDAEDVAANLAQTAAAFREAAERARAAARRAREVSVPPLRVSLVVRCPFGGPGLDGDSEDAEPDLEACLLFLPGLAAGVRLHLPGPPAAAQGPDGLGGERRREGGRHRRRKGGRDGAGGGGGEAGRGAGPATKSPRLTFGGFRPGALYAALESSHASVSQSPVCCCF